MAHVFLQEIIEEFNLTYVTKVGDSSKIKITTRDVNRPGIHLLGFFDKFDTKRIQIFGEGEMSLLSTLDKTERERIINAFFKHKIPCVIVARGIKPFPEMLEASKKFNIPILKTAEDTSIFLGAIIRYLNLNLAPKTSIHGVLVEVYGQGVLITGESGIGKSETALELIKRGHGFIADDIVEVKKISYNNLLGEAPELLKNFIEIRGLGLIDIKNIFGMGSIKENYPVDIMINLENWDSKKSYDRLGLDEEYTDIMGIKIPLITIPVKPGRNLAVIIEVAAMNLRQKNLGYNAAQTLNDRLNDKIKSKGRNKS